MGSTHAHTDMITTTLTNAQREVSRQYRHALVGSSIFGTSCFSARCLLCGSDDSQSFGDKASTFSSPAKPTFTSITVESSFLSTLLYVRSLLDLDDRRLSRVDDRGLLLRSIGTGTALGSSSSMFSNCCCSMLVMHKTLVFQTIYGFSSVLEIVSCFTEQRQREVVVGQSVLDLFLLPNCGSWKKEMRKCAEATPALALPVL